MGGAEHLDIKSCKRTSVLLHIHNVICTNTQKYAMCTCAANAHRQTHTHTHTHLITLRVIVHFTYHTRHMLFMPSCLTTASVLACVFLHMQLVRKDQPIRICAT